MKLTAGDLKRLGIIERVIEEPDEFSDSHMGSVCRALDEGIQEFLGTYTKIPAEELTEKRYARFRRM